MMFKTCVQLVYNFFEHSCNPKIKEERPLCQRLNCKKLQNLIKKVQILYTKNKTNIKLLA